MDRNHQMRMGLEKYAGLMVPYTRENGDQEVAMEKVHYYLLNGPFIHPINSCFSSFFIVPFLRYRNVPFQTCIRRPMER